ncbi:MAG: MBL fold metallo-hydrolase [Caldilineaceae bacterium]|nr:MBL fold metallo-hydrolase [Caldilineaceae bacterium]
MPSTPAPIRIELPFAIEKKTVNAYLFREPEPVLIDTGDWTDATWQALLAGLARQGLTPADLSKVIITHVHTDHIGQAARLAEESDAEFVILDAGYEWLTRFTDMWQSRSRYYARIFLPGADLTPEQRGQMADYGKWVNEHYRGVPAARVTAIAPDTRLELGGATWQALHLPGHAVSQSCFYQPESRQFLASDMLLQRTPTPVIEPNATLDGREPALPQFIHSLHRVDAMEIDWVLPGHGEPFADAHELIQRQLARIDRRKEECFTQLAGGATTARELLAAMYPPAPFINMAGLWMVIGYLDLLQAEGRVAMGTEDGVWRYRPREK